jgi:hypothetical protein
MDATDEIEVNVNNGFCGDGSILLVHLCPRGIFLTLWNEI